MVETAEMLIPVFPVEEQERRRRRSESAFSLLWELLDSVRDPEVPALSLWDLGVLQDIEKHGDEVVVTITPTYSGCPAMGAMEEDITDTLNGAGFAPVSVITRLTPVWTTDWLSQKARERLREYGIAPPAQVISCPRCDSSNLRLISDFGSTACKALYQCLNCAEPFDYFKSI